MLRGVEIRFADREIDDGSSFRLELADPGRGEDARGLSDAGHPRSRLVLGHFSSK
jgi:hypothetical protein